MKTMTHTSTKTAVAWMLVGGIAALAASMALGLPWDRTHLDNQLINIGKTNGKTDISNIITHKRLKCYYMVNGKEIAAKSSWEIGSPKTGTNEEQLKKDCKDLFNGTSYTIIDDNREESEHYKLP